MRSTTALTLSREQWQHALAHMKETPVDRVYRTMIEEDLARFPWLDRITIVCFAPEYYRVLGALRGKA